MDLESEFITIRNTILFLIVHSFQMACKAFFGLGQLTAT